MTQGYYCEKCRKFVLAVGGSFNHPDLGMKTCLTCAKCGGMVYLKKQEGGTA